MSGAARIWQPGLPPASAVRTHTWAESPSSPTRIKPTCVSRPRRCSPKWGGHCVPSALTPVTLNICKGTAFSSIPGGQTVTQKHLWALAETGRLCLVPSHSSLGSPICTVGWRWWAWDPSVKHYKHSPWHKPRPRQGHGDGLPPHCGDLPGRLTGLRARGSLWLLRGLCVQVGGPCQKTF